MTGTDKAANAALWRDAGYEIVNTGSQFWAAQKVIRGVLFSAVDNAESDMPDPCGNLSVSAFDADTFEYLDACWEAANLHQIEQLIPTWLYEMRR